MDLLSPADARGHVIGLITTDPRHFSGRAAEKEVPTAEESFGNLFFKALSTVNDQQQKSMSLAEAMITDPDSVNVHDVTLALAEANLSLSMTKTIMERVIRAYREIVSIR